MTDKEIIIDGVDVSECEYYQYNMCTATKDNYGDCSYYCKDYDMKDCYFKQLTRKTQECEELKNIINDAKNSGLDLKSFLLSEAIQKEYEEKIDKLKAEKEQAEQKLEKIRQICSCSKGQMNCEQCPMCDECEELCVNDENLQDIILQIIYEVE